MQAQSVFPLPKDVLSTAAFQGSKNAYLDIVPTKDGYNHIALFPIADTAEPVWLTSGEWEVTGSIKGVGLNSKGEWVVYASSVPFKGTAVI